MENEIKVNEYVRTKDGLIRRVKKIDMLIYIDEVYISNEPEYHDSLIKDDIVEHSPNLIDLIEVGDYVNGKQVSNVDKVDNTNFIEWTDGDMYKTEIENDKFIKTIVTKEQFESISYKVKE